MIPKSATTPRRPRAGALLLALLFGVLSLLPAAQVWADEGDSALQVLEVGWDGHVTTGAWAPVRVKVTGTARDLDALVEVTLENKYQTGPATTMYIPLAAYAQEVSLPAGASKEVTVWVPTGHGLQGTVRLKAGDQVLGSREIEFRMTKAPYWPLVGVLSDQEMLPAQLGRIQLPLQNLPTEINVARLKAEALPTLPDRMKGLMAIVAQGNAPSRLTDGQRQAIADWVKNGGHLLLAGGPDSALTAAVLPPSTLPVTFGGTELNQDLSELGPWAGHGPAVLAGPAAKMQTTGGVVLVGTPEQPLAWRMAHGKGTITVLAVDPTLEPLASYGGITPLLKKALGPALPEGSQSPEEEKMRMIGLEQDVSYRLRNTIDALPSDAYPGWKEVALYLGAFALLAGPVVHLLFWQGRRRGWVWLAVPVVSVLVAGGIYVVGIARGGQDMMGHTLSYLQIDPKSQTASQTMMVGLYAPMHKDVAVTIDSDAPINAMGMLESVRFGPWGPEQATEESRPPFRVITGRETRMEFYANEWIMRPLSLTRTLGQEVGQITSKLTLDGTLIKGTVTNGTPYHLEHVAVAVSGKAVRLGELAPGQSLEVSLEPAEATPFYHMSLGLLFFGEKLSEEQMKQYGPIPAGATEPMEAPTDPELQRRMRLLESVLYRPSYGPETVSLPLTFIAFTRDAVGGDVVDLKGHPNHRLTLIEQRLQLDLPAGSFTLPPNLIPSTMGMYNTRGMGSSSDGTLTWIEVDYGTVVYTFTPPLPPGATVTALEITTQLMGDPLAGEMERKAAPVAMTPQAAVEGIFQIYNYNAAVWENLPGGQESVRLTNVAPYLGSDNQVQVQINTGNNKIIRFVTPKLTMEGRGAQ